MIKYANNVSNTTELLSFSAFSTYYDMFRPTWPSSGNTQYTQNTWKYTSNIKIAASGVDSRVVVWISEFLIDRSQRVRVGGHYSEEVRVTSGVPEGSVLGPLCS